MAHPQHDEDWQSTKRTVSERIRHMYNNPLMSDVAISCEGSDKKFFAHKNILAITSTEFHAMFYDEQPETNQVVYLPDTDEKSVEELLRFIYTDACNLTAGNVVSVLRLAEKYVVPSLAEKCRKYFEQNLAPDNVFVALQQALQFDKELEKKCWDMIESKTSEVVKSDAFTGISQSTLEQLLKREWLNIKEVELFNAVVEWSEAECSRKEKEVNAKNQRAVIGNAIHHILFASMTHQEFAWNVSQSGMLDQDELVLFYDVFGGVERTSKVWNMAKKRTKTKLLRVCRFGHYDFCVYKDKDINMKSTTKHVLGVSFSKPVKFHGVRLLGGHGQEKHVTFEVSSHKVEKKFESQLEGHKLYGFDVMLDVPVEVDANKQIIMIATITGLPSPHITSQGRSKVSINGITVIFHHISDMGSCLTRVEHGEFDEIIFSEI